MEVIFLTTLFSVVFAILFLLFFLRMRQNEDSCADQDALLPFRDGELDGAIAEPTPLSTEKNTANSNDQR
ncbi:MAG: hypothetical protein P1U58_08895 [Verrucomicrobiales bacterium]|nr:hypothetical protein [Verrucomicrobiales bacterium]